MYLSPIQFPLPVSLVIRTLAALVEVTVVVPTDYHDMSESIRRSRPWLLQGLEPVDGLLNVGDCAVVCEIAGVDEEVAFWKRLWGDLAVGVGDADDADWDRV